MKNYFKINEMSKFFDMNTSALRYYERYGLITPAFIDPHTHYRYYDLSNINTLAYIIDLKNAGMSMNQIKDYILGKYSKTEFIETLNAIKIKVDKLIKMNELKNARENAFCVEEIEIDSFKCFMQKYEVQDLEDIYNKYYQFLNLCVDKCTISDNFAGFIEFDNICPSFENQTIKIGIHIEKSKEKYSTFPKTKVLRTFYKGKYEDIAKAYDALKNFAIKNNVSLKGNAIEVYHESFNMNRNTDEFLTEIIFPILT